MAAFVACVTIMDLFLLLFSARKVGNYFMGLWSNKCTISHKKGPFYKRSIVIRYVAF
jgi:hypothetical protein